MEPLRILLVDDHTVLRSGLRHMLATHGEFTVVGEAASGIEAIEQARTLKPGLVLLDLSMPGIGGQDALVRIHADLPWVKVVVLTMHDDPGYVRQALAAGAVGYVLKTAADEELLTALRVVVRGGTYVYPTLASRVLQGGSDTPGPSDNDGGLSQRETQVLQLLALGYTNQEVAEQLVVGIRTVETYRKRIMEKLNLHTRSQLVRYALAHHLIEE